MTPQSYREKLMIIHSYLERLPDGIKRTICFLYANGYSNGKIRKRLKLTEEEFRRYRVLIRIDLIDSGIQL